jgi:murein DD-endopeptidase MepM/ murein hydrolase activator NlpD
MTTIAFGGGFMKRTLLEKMGDFVLGKGFYIVLFLCVATIGISGYYLMNSFDAEMKTPVTGNPEVVLPDPATSVPEVKAPQVPTQPAEERKAQTVQPKEDRATKQNPAPAPAPAVSYVWPVEGEVLRGFSVEALAYDQTMGDWRTHAGVDIAAEAGAKVQCVSDGVVKEVFTDDLMGATVVVDHQNGVMSTYSNLAAEPVAAAGQEVESGTVLGTVGASAIAESALPSHLHLEMTRNGEPVDPVGLFSD